MSQSTLFRIAAAGLIAGAVITALASLVSPQNSDSITAAVASPFFYPSGLGVTLGGIAIVLCVPAVYIRQHASSGVLGLIGAILIVAGGMALTVFVNLFDVIAMPWVIGLHLTSSQLQGGPPAFNIFWPVASIAVTLGGVLLGIAIIRARVLGRATGVVLIVGALASFGLNFLPATGIVGALGEVSYMVALAWCGVALWRSVPSLESAAGTIVREVA